MHYQLAHMAFRNGGSLDDMNTVEPLQEEHYQTELMENGKFSPFLFSIHYTDTD